MEIIDLPVRSDLRRKNFEIDHPDRYIVERKEFLELKENKDEQVFGMSYEEYNYNEIDEWKRIVNSVLSKSGIDEGEFV